MNKSTILGILIAPFLVSCSAPVNTSRSAICSETASERSADILKGVSGQKNSMGYRYFFVIFKDSYEPLYVPLIGPVVEAENYLSIHYPKCPTNITPTITVNAFDQTAYLTIGYFQGIGDTYWKVKFDFKGKISGVETGVAVDGTPK